MASNLETIASNLRAMAFNLRAILSFIKRSRVNSCSKGCRKSARRWRRVQICEVCDRVCRVDLEEVDPGGSRFLRKIL